MKKGGRFIWYNWSESIYSNSQETKDYLEFEGHCKVYTYLNTSIVHKRIVKQFKNTILFEINDKIENIENINLPIKQLWHISADFEKDGWKIECRDEKNNLLKPNYIKALHSAYYGMKEESTCISFENSKGIFNTKIIKL
jgi:hypothetical protein